MSLCMLTACISGLSRNLRPFDDTGPTGSAASYRKAVYFLVEAESDEI
jgi:hypothetical protein